MGVGGDDCSDHTTSFLLHANYRKMYERNQRIERNRRSAKDRQTKLPELNEVLEQNVCGVSDENEDDTSIPFWSDIAEALNPLLRTIFNPQANIYFCGEGVKFTCCF